MLAGDSGAATAASAVVVAKYSFFARGVRVGSWGATADPDRTNTR
jgi:hypothetical protein